MAQPPPPPPPPVTPSIDTLPTYSPDDEWLQLSLKIITTSGNTGNTARFLALYKALPKEVQRDYKTLLTSNNPNTYNDLVRELTSRFQMPDHTKFQTLHTLEPIGDRSPKQFLRDLQNKYQAAGGISNNNLRYAFALGLPTEFRNVVFSTNPNNLTDAANIVDDMWNATKSLAPAFNPYMTPQVSINTFHPDLQGKTDLKAATTISNLQAENQRLNTTLEQMTEMMQKLNKRLTDLETPVSPPQYQAPQRRQFSETLRPPNHNKCSCRTTFNIPYHITH